MRRCLVLLCVIVGLAHTAAPIWAQASPPCQFVLGFLTVYHLIPSTVGACVDEERHNPANGDALQQTVNGLLVWRKADNFTAFTDGYRSWVNGPYGIQERLNSQRFSWEADRGAPGTTAAPASAAGAALRVLLCETSHGVAGQVMPPPPTTLAPDTTSPLLGQLAFYTDGGMFVLAPRDWSCHAVVGADGQETVSVYPPQAASYDRPPDCTLGADLQGCLSPQLSVPVISAHGYSACLGCVAYDFCALFPVAWTSWGNGNQRTCPYSVPPQEQHDYLTPSVATFEDPPGVVGDGNPSGSVWPSNGVALYSPYPRVVSYKETCLLPEPDHAECTAILNDFVARYGP